MKKEHTVNLSCAFCGKSQREVEKLIAGPNVFICDECVGLCDQILAGELSREHGRATSPESARGILGSLVEQVARVAELLLASATYEGSPLPEEMKQEIRRLVEASRALRSETERWNKAEPGERAALAALEPCIINLSRSAEALRTLGPVLDTLVAEEELDTIHEAIRSIVEVRGLLVSIAAK